ncbi:MAG: GAF domain-containing sensor histidine kinase [Salinimicrobium sp.]
MVHLEFDQAALKEAARIEILRKYDILDTPPDGRFDRITKLAATLLKVPVAIISLVDTDRVWFKSKFGIEQSEVGREPGLCASAILSDELYLIEDARKDPRTLANPLVRGEFGLKFYSAVPLKTIEGQNLGTLCVIDKEPRTLSEEEKEVLKDLAGLVMDQIELQLEARTAVKHHHQILNTTAHDLKNPVSIMPLLADLIMQNKNNPEAIDDISKQIKDAGRRMALTINELLENAMDGAGNSHLRLEVVDLKELVQGVVNANRALARKKEQQLVFNLAETCFVFADHRRLTEVVDNVINNAIKFSLPETHINVLLKSVDGKAVLEVKDEGQGLTKDDQKNLFRKFTSLSARPTGGEISTGLGLFLAKEVLAAHKGTISATSDGKGKGSCFRIELPLSED